MTPHRLATALLRPVDIASVVFFRVAFGLVMLWEVKRYFDHDWIARYWLEPSYHFTYPFFGWVRPWSGDGMYVHFYALGTLALFIALGFLYRLSAALFFLGFAYVFLLEQARYLNHFYFIILISFLMIFVPAHRALSVDALIRPRLRSDRIPAWGPVLLAGQMGIVYFFGGVAKINVDWLRGEPLRTWLARRTGFPLIGPLFTDEWVVYLCAYGGLLLDLLAIPLLLWRRTRPLMFALLISFHFMNDRLFSIGIFPWLALAATTLFFPPDWPRRLARDLRAGPAPRARFAWSGGLALGLATVWLRKELELVPVALAATAGALLGQSAAALQAKEAPGERSLPRRHSPDLARRGLDREGAMREHALTGHGLTCALVVVWFALQIAIPLRHFVIPGVVSWTEEGHNFSWHMKLRAKRGTVRFRVTDPTSGRSWKIDPRELLERWQYRKMTTRPHMIHQFARHLAREAEARGHPGVSVRVNAEVSLNGRERRRLIDPRVDLVGEPHRLGAAPWIEPLRD